MAVQAIAEFYLGEAELESLDATTLKPQKPIDSSQSNKVSGALEHFRASKEKLSSALGHCAALNSAENTELPKKLGAELDQIIAGLEKNTAPTIANVHGAAITIQAIVSSGAKRAIAHQGTPGHMSRGTQ